jgi:signal transduction histidine kinase
MPPPSRAVSAAVSIALVVVWAIVRLAVLNTTMFPLTYALPLLVCVWTRDRVALWSMAAVFVVLHAVKLFWIIPPGTFSSVELWTNYGATLTNVSVGAVAVHLIINLRGRLEAALEDLRSQAEELRTQGEELTQQNEELARQGEELSTQNEELQSQTEEIGVLNDTLERREHLLESLLEMARFPSTEAAALEHIVTAGRDLFDRRLAAVVVWERTTSGLTLRAFAGDEASGVNRNRLPGETLVRFVFRDQRTAAVDDLGRRPDLCPPGTERIRAMLCAVVPLGDAPAAALAIYSAQPRTWDEDEFRRAEWLAGQCSRVLLALRLQAELREGDRRKSEFLATLSHELRNPLAPMRHALELLEADADKADTALPVLKRQFKQLVRLVDDLLDATRLSTNKIQLRKARTDVSVAVRQMLEGCRAEIVAAGHAVTVDVPTRPVWVDADPDRLAQVLGNLLGNAIRYTPALGRIRIAVESSASGAVITVSDNGMGLEAADLERVFEMFTQVGGRTSDGLGIGLALVRGIVELHGGYVEARSEGLGRGTEFRVTLPLASGTAVTINAKPARVIENGAVLPIGSPPPAPSLATPRRILVVDDNVDAATMMASLLELHGHHVHVAHDAVAALETSRRFEADVALLDIGLPGIDGYDLARQLRATAGSRPLRLIALTGWGQDGDRARASAAGFDAHLTKPAEPSVVLAAVDGN